MQCDVNNSDGKNCTVEVIIKLGRISGSGTSHCKLNARKYKQFFSNMMVNKFTIVCWFLSTPVVSVTCPMLARASAWSSSNSNVFADQVAMSMFTIRSGFHENAFFSGSCPGIRRSFVNAGFILVLPKC